MCLTCDIDKSFFIVYNKNTKGHSGGVIMATSSIFASFNINDSKTANAFAEALD